MALSKEKLWDHMRAPPPSCENCKRPGYCHPQGKYMRGVRNNVDYGNMFCGVCLAGDKQFTKWKWNGIK